MRGTRRRGREKHQIAGLKILRRDVPSSAVQIRHRSWDGYAVLTEHVLDESAAIETAGICAAVTIGAPAEPQRRPGDRVTVGWHRRPGRRDRNGLRRWGWTRPATRYRERLRYSARRRARGTPGSQNREGEGRCRSHTGRCPHYRSIVEVACILALSRCKQSPYAISSLDRAEPHRSE
jgi:hypothetical protein